MHEPQDNETQGYSSILIVRKRVFANCLEQAKSDSSSWFDLELLLTYLPESGFDKRKE